MRAKCAPTCRVVCIACERFEDRKVAGIAKKPRLQTDLIPFVVAFESATMPPPASNRPMPDSHVDLRRANGDVPPAAPLRRQETDANRNTHPAAAPFGSRDCAHRRAFRRAGDAAARKRRRARSGQRRRPAAQRSRNRRGHRRERRIALDVEQCVRRERGRRCGADRCGAGRRSSGARRGSCRTRARATRSSARGAFHRLGFDGASIECKEQFGRPRQNRAGPVLDERLIASHPSGARSERTARTGRRRRATQTVRCS